MIIVDQNDTHARVLTVEVLDDGPTAHVVENGATRESHPDLLHGLHVNGFTPGFGKHIVLSMKDVPLEEVETA